MTEARTIPQGIMVDATTAIQDGYGNPILLGKPGPNSVGVVRQSWCNVLDFGAVGDGITDDTTAFQNAINAAESMSGTLIVPAANYLVTGLTLSYPITMQGLGGWGVGDVNAAKITLKAGSNTHLLQFTPPAPNGVVGAVFQNLVFDQQGSQQTAGCCVYALGAIHCVFDHCHFTNPYDAGVHCYQDGNGNTGHHNRFVHCLFDGGSTSASGNGNGLLLEASDENFVLSCDFENNGRPGGSQPHQLYDRSGLQNIFGCSFVGGQTGVKCEGSGSRVAVCIFDGCGDHCVRLNGNDHLITGCTFYSMGANSASNTLDGVYVDNVANATITSCVFMPNSNGGCRSGVNLSSGPATNASILDNKFATDTGSYGTSAVIVSTGTGHRITGNSGFNAQGPQTAPTIPASGTGLLNPFPYDCMVYVTGGTVTAISIGGTATGMTGGPIWVPVHSTIALTYSVAPAWTWFAD